jgi:hypothetical protein
VEIGVDRNTTVVFPAPLMSTIGEIGAFLAKETAAAGALPLVPANPAIPRSDVPNGSRPAVPQHN